MAHPATGFRFNTGNGFTNLVQAITNNAVADNVHSVNPLVPGTTVTVLAKVGDHYVATRGIATGVILDTPTQAIWPTWDNATPTVVHQVVNFTLPISIPADVARACNTTAIRNADARILADYIADHPAT